MRHLELALLALVLNSAPARAGTYVVRADGTGDFPTIQAALGAAGTGDVILLATGTFTGSGNRDLTFLGKRLTLRSQSGVADSVLIDCQGSAAEPHRAFTFAGGEDSLAVVEGVTLTRGYADYGGAVLCQGTSRPGLRGCILRDNHATANGGGVYAAAPASVVLDDCRFERNTAHTGAGAYTAGGGGIRGRVTDCVFTGNSAEHSGGGVYLSYTSWVSRCVFSANTAKYGGGIFGGAAPGGATDCRFEGNTVGMFGGAVYSVDAVSHCLFRQNHANAGGALYLVSSISDCTFVENTAQSYAGACDLGPGPSVDRCTFAGNSSPQGSVIVAEGFAQRFLQNCIIAFNLGGAALASSHSSSITLDCCDLFGNAGGNGSYVFEDTSVVLFTDPLFCGDYNPESPYSLQVDSPCLVAGNPARQIGAWGEGCAPAAVPMPVVSRPGGVIGPAAPNPFRLETSIPVCLPSGAGAPARVVRAEIVDVSGRWVCDLPLSLDREGCGSVRWDGTGARGRLLSSGAYWCRIHEGRRRLQTRLLFLR